MLKHIYSLAVIGLLLSGHHLSAAARLSNLAKRALQTPRAKPTLPARPFATRGFADNYFTRNPHFAQPIQRGYARLENTALHDAITAGKIAEAKALIDAVSTEDINVHDLDAWTPLHLATLGNQVETVAALLAKGAHVDAQNSHGKTALHLAAADDNCAIASLLITYGPDQDAVDDTGMTPLHEAARKNNHKIIDLLAEAGAQIDLLPHKTSVTPLHLAVMCNHTAAFYALAEAGAHLEPVEMQASSTPLHAAAFHENAQIVGYLIQHHVNLNARDANGKTPLHCAVQGRALGVIRQLLAAGADLHALDEDKKTPADYAYDEVIDFLKQYLDTPAV